ncbi:MAG: response regulator transcription factor [Dehalococcoidales bacterium]|nr:response regulator transcription factor [Dehalococcoidales bacterium]
MGATIRVLIADDHPIVRQGLAAILASEKDLELVGEAADGEEAVARALALRPDVVVVDLRMPLMDGLSATREIVGGLPGIKVLILAALATGEQVLAAVRSGASGFLLKDVAASQLIDSIRAVRSGARVLDASVTQDLLEKIEHPRSLGGATPNELTARELDVLRLLAQGMSNQEMAQALHLTQNTVMTHVRNILHKLRLENRTRAALYARDKGLV